MTAFNIAHSIASYVAFRIIGDPEETPDLKEWTDETGAAMVDNNNAPIIFTP